MARKTGKHATLTIGAYTGADLFDVEIAVNAEVVDVTALEDDWMVRVPGVGSWELRARKYYVTEEFLSLVRATPGSATPVTVTVTDGGSTTIFSGTGYVTEGTFHIPNEEITETVKVVGTGVPTTP